MSKKQVTAIVVMNCIFLISSLVLILAFCSLYVYVLYHPGSEDETFVTLAKTIIISYFPFILMNAITVSFLVKHYNSFGLWIESRHNSNTKNSSQKVNSLNNIVENQNVGLYSMQMFVLPWGILCFLSPMFLQVPMYIMMQNWRKISILENAFLQKAGNILGMENRSLKPIVFSTKDLWFWALVFNLSGSFLSPIWIFFYLRKVRHFVEDIRISLNLINKLLNN